MKRTKGITAVCILCGLLAVAGFGDALVIFSGTVATVPAWLGYFTLLFGITAGGAAAGLWQLKRWGLIALRCWFVACLVLILATAYAFYPAIPGGIIVVIVFTVVVAGILLAIDRFVASRIDIPT